MPERTSIESASGRRPSSDRAWRGAGAVGEEKLEKAHFLGLPLEVPVSGTNAVTTRRKNSAALALRQGAEIALRN